MMKYFQKMFAFAALAFLFLVGSTTKSQAQNVTVSYQMFYDNLAPYGQWIYDPEYGNVWVPNEDGNFRPYGSRGYWVMTEYGNTWVSDDPWGWAVYHYGRWSYNPYYGWVWIPGYEWAPAWVSWRFGGGSCGWAPLGPGINVGMNYYAPDSWWIFVGPQYMYQPNCIQYWRGPRYNTTYINQTTIVNNYYIDNSTRVRYNYGPRGEVIQQYTGRRVPVYQVSNVNRPGAISVGRNSVNIYRPEIDRGSVRTANPRGVVQAPRAIGRGQQVVQSEGGRQPQFRQDIQRNQPDGRGDRGSMQEPSRGDRGSYQEPSRGDRGTMQEPSRGDRGYQQPNQGFRNDYRRADNPQEPTRIDRVNPTMPDRSGGIRNVQPTPQQDRSNSRGQDMQPAQRNNSIPPRLNQRNEGSTNGNMQPRQYDNRFDRGLSTPSAPQMRPSSAPQPQGGNRQPSAPQQMQGGGGRGGR